MAVASAGPHASLHLAPDRQAAGLRSTFGKVPHCKQAYSHSLVRLFVRTCKSHREQHQLEVVINNSLSGDGEKQNGICLIYQDAYASSQTGNLDLARNLTVVERVNAVCYT